MSAFFSPLTFVGRKAGRPAAANQRQEVCAEKHFGRANAAIFQPPSQPLFQRLCLVHVEALLQATHKAGYSNPEMEREQMCQLKSYHQAKMASAGETGAPKAQLHGSRAAALQRR